MHDEEIDPIENKGSNQTFNSEEEGPFKGIKSDTGSPTPALDNFSTDITKLVKTGSVCPVIGRDKEIRRLTQILSRKNKKNAILCGNPGCGKSAIVDGLAMLINKPDAPMALINKRVLSLDLTSVVAGTKYRGQFEERMKVIIEELKANPNIILFIDEIHTIVGAGNSAGSMDASNILKPALARGEIQVIGATTLDEYREKIEKDGALTRRFKEVMVEEPSLSETKEILMNIKSYYEDFHKVIYSEEVIDECVKLSDRYITDRSMPDKAIDILDEVGAILNIAVTAPDEVVVLEKELADILTKKMELVKSQDFEGAAEMRKTEKNISDKLTEVKKTWAKKSDEVRKPTTIEMVTDVVSSMTGIPLNKISTKENQRLIDMDKELNSKVIGQEEAVLKISKAIKRSRVGIKDHRKPLSVFMLLGGSGTGKTLTAKLLAEHVFGDSDALIRVDMSEYMEKYSVSKLIGSAPGYIGYEEGGQLTEKVRRRPYSVILLDEIEKAHDDVFNLLLQVFDEGHLTDSLGRKVNFKNTLILMTSNLGVKDVSESTSLGFTSSKNSDLSEEIRVKGIIEKALKKRFKPEFLNRLDDTIIYNNLSKEHISKIVHLELNKLNNRIKELGYTINVSEDVVSYLGEVGYDSKYGARPLNRAIQKYIEDEICEAILNETVVKGQVINISIEESTKKIIVS